MLFKGIGYRQIPYIPVQITIEFQSQTNMLLNAKLNTIENIGVTCLLLYLAIQYLFPIDEWSTLFLLSSEREY